MNALRIASALLALACSMGAFAQTSPYANRTEALKGSRRRRPRAARTR
jgi:hypothetical protein